MKHWQWIATGLDVGHGRALRWSRSVAAAVLASMLIGVGAPALAQGSPGALDLHSIVRSGDIEALRRAVDGGADINARDP